MYLSNIMLESYITDEINLAINTNGNIHVSYADCKKELISKNENTLNV